MLNIKSNFCEYKYPFFITSNGDKYTAPISQSYNGTEIIFLAQEIAWTEKQDMRKCKIIVKGWQQTMVQF